MPASARARRRQERAWRQWPGPSRPFASPAPGRGIGAPIPLPRCNPARTPSRFWRHLPQQPQCRASILPPYAAQLRVGPSSKVEFNLAAIPPGLAGLRLRTPYAAIVHVRSAPVSGGYGHLLASVLQSLPGSQDTAVPAVGADSVSHPVFLFRLPPSPKSRAASHRLRGSARISVVASCFYSTVTACSRGRLYPAPTSFCAHKVGRSGPGRGGRLSTHSVGLFRCSREPEVSLPRRSRARRPNTARPPPRPRSTAFRALGHWETLSRASASRSVMTPSASPAPQSRLRDSQQPRPTRGTTPQPQC